MIKYKVQCENHFVFCCHTNRLMFHYFNLKCFVVHRWMAHAPLYVIRFYHAVKIFWEDLCIHFSRKDLLLEDISWHPHPPPKKKKKEPALFLASITTYFRKKKKSLTTYTASTTALITSSSQNLDEQFANADFSLVDHLLTRWRDQPTMHTMQLFPTCQTETRITGCCFFHSDLHFSMTPTGQLPQMAQSPPLTLTPNSPQDPNSGLS